MRKGMSLLEVLALVVMVAILTGILLPLIGRHRYQDGPRTQCRSNMRQIGLALTIYSNDNGGWSPAQYGSANVSEEGERQFVWGDGAQNQPNLNWQAWTLTKSVYVGKSEADSVTDDLCGDFVTGTGKGWLQYKGANGDPGMYRGGIGTDERIRDSEGQGRQTAAITGLGLLFSGGYLTQKGGHVLLCPSYPVAMDSRTLGSALENAFRQDNTEPFWSIRDIPCWDSDNADGDNDPLTGLDAVTNGNGIQDLATIMWGPESSNGKGLSKGKGSAACDWLVTNYWLRLKAENHGVFKVKENPSLAIVSDTLLGNFDGIVASQRVRGIKGTGETRRNGDAGDGGGFIRNHDAAYNVLFADGAVKTFSDAAQALRNALAATDDATGSGDRKNYTFVKEGNGEQNDLSRTGNAFDKYLDPIYTED